MSNIINSFTPQNEVPVNYTVPQWPALYWPFPVVNGTSAKAQYLYEAYDIWRFTVIWTQLFFGTVHLVTSATAVFVQWHNWKVIWLVPVIYAFIAGVEALFAGSMVGGLLAAVYTAGYFKMPTWIPFVWGLINTLVLILSSFAVQGGL